MLVVNGESKTNNNKSKYEYLNLIDKNPTSNRHQLNFYTNSGQSTLPWSVLHSPVDVEISFQIEKIRN